MVSTAGVAFLLHNVFTCTMAFHSLRSVKKWLRETLAPRSPASILSGIQTPSAIPDEWEGVPSDPEQTARAFIQAGDSTGLYRLLTGCSLDWARLDRHGRSLLTLAVGAGQLECVQALLEAGADIQKHTHGAEPLLSTAAIQGHINVINFLLSLGVELEARGNHRRTALHCAAALGRLDCVAALVSAGADLLPLDEFGATPLAMATVARHMVTIEFLCAAEVARDEKRMLTQILGKTRSAGTRHL